ncbi:MAG TPA: tRNA 2-thiouridine(34) synthase MnmA [Nitrospirota bacterium]|nr:tRNA 2-thiouridine(34) synthase MnmA [Nitrospirota bacterium]
MRKDGSRRTRWKRLRLQISNIIMSKRVLVAMSGGVDSSVTAALLQNAGMHVEGATMKLAAGLCCDIGSAADVCTHLHIPHRIIHAEDEFSRQVVKDFISEYRCGRTPNPCVRCNERIKFSLLLDYAREQGFDYLATGHYARIEQEPGTSLFVLKKGLDKAKDQSYFLYRLTQAQLKNILFPLGGMSKSEVRAAARSFGLPAAERPESQEVCFIPDNDYRTFLKEHAPETLRPGEMVLSDGKIVGQHTGIAFFTVGQRRHLGVAAGDRLYVIRIDAKTNRVVLGRLTELQKREMMVADPVFVSTSPQMPVAATVKIRYRSPLVPAVIERASHEALHVIFDHPVSGICPGQAAVIYDGDRIIGGGIIANY